MQNEKYDLNSNDVFFLTNTDDDFYFLANLVGMRKLYY